MSTTLGAQLFRLKCSCKSNRRDSDLIVPRAINQLNSVVSVIHAWPARLLPQSVNMQVFSPWLYEDVDPFHFHLD